MTITYDLRKSLEPLIQKRDNELTDIQKEAVILKAFIDTTTDSNPEGRFTTLEVLEMPTMLTKSTIRQVVHTLYMQGYLSISFEDPVQSIKFFELTPAGKRYYNKIKKHVVEYNPVESDTKKVKVKGFELDSSMIKHFRRSFEILIDNKMVVCSWPQFKAIFFGTSSFLKVEWTASLASLHYFIYSLPLKKRTKFSIACNCFLHKSNPVTEEQLMNNKMSMISIKDKEVIEKALNISL